MIEPVLWPYERSEQQKAEIDTSDGEYTLPEFLEDENIYSTTFIGVPGESTVFEISFSPDDASPSGWSASADARWLLEAQNNGWEVVRCYAHHCNVVGSRLFRLWVFLSVHLPFGRKFIGSTRLSQTVRIQKRESEDSEVG